MSTQATSNPSHPSPPPSAPRSFASPPPVPTLDTEALRRKLAGLADPLPRSVGKGEQTEIRDLASRFCSILAHLFSDSLDRLTLWDRIGSALKTALAKVSDDDCDRFVTLCLEHVQADAGKAAACEPLGQVIATLDGRPPEWRHAFLQYIGTHGYSVLVHGRRRWEMVKSKEAEL